MAEIEKKGIIPASNAVLYKDNLKISDDNIGKYISLSNYKKFHNIGIGLDLSSPNTNTTTISKNFIVNKNRYHEQHLPYGPAYGSLAGYITYDITSPAVNDIQGINLSNVGVNILAWPDIGKTNYNINTINVPTNGGKILTVAQSGKYVFNFKVNGDLRFYRNGNKNNGMRNITIATDFKVNSNITNIQTNSLFPNTSAGIYIFDSRNSPLTYNVDFTKTVDLVQGDTVQIYSRLFIINANESNNKNEDLDLHAEIRYNNFSLTVNQEMVTGPSQTYFTNPQGIVDFNTKGINYYGNNRDTLKLIGNKLTS